MIIFPLRSRVLEPEWLDSLPVSDPGAIRSREDLVRLDGVMGNSRWIFKNLPGKPRSAIELGAGDGRLARRLAPTLNSYTALDLAPRPAALPDSISWKEGDFFQTLQETPSDLVLGSLILHHFSNQQLASLGASLKDRKNLLFVEPLRTWETLVAAGCALPFVGAVTRHDMLISIRSGFLPGEISVALGLGPEWQISETPSLARSLRFMAWRD